MSAHTSHYKSKQDFEKTELHAKYQTMQSFPHYLQHVVQFLQSWDIGTTVWSKELSEIGQLTAFVKYWDIVKWMNWSIHSGLLLNYYISIRTTFQLEPHSISILHYEFGANVTNLVQTFQFFYYYESDIEPQTFPRELKFHSCIGFWIKFVVIDYDMSQIGHWVVSSHLSVINFIMLPRYARLLPNNNTALFEHVPMSSDVFISSRNK